MKVLNDIIEICEKKIKKRNNYYSVITLLSRLYLRFLETGSLGYADNAFFISVKSLKYNTQNIIYVLSAAFFEMETGRNGAAYKRISVCENYKGYLKNSQPEIYAFYLYIKALIMFRRKETRNSVKLYREIVGLYEQNDHLNSILILSALLNIEYDNFGSAKKRLESCIGAGKENYLLYICLYKYFSSKNKSVYFSVRLFYPFLKWGVSHGINLQNIINLYTNKLYDIFAKDRALCIKLYDLYENEEILKQICTHYIEKNDFSKEAFKYYRFAVNKQLFIPGINNYFIRGSFFNEKTEFGIYPIKTFLKFGNMKEDIKPFIYYIVLNNKKFSDILKENFFNIAEFGIESIKKRLSGKYYGDIYRFVIENADKLNISDSYIKMMMDVIFPMLFLCEIKLDNLNAEHCFVFEKIKRKADVYNIKNGICEMSIISEQPDFFITDKKNQFIECGISVRKYVENVKFSLCRKIYSEGYSSNELDMALANYYLDAEYPENMSIDIFERVLRFDISDDFRMKILSALGNLHYYNADLKRALECFKNVELKYIKDKYVQNLFEVFMYCGEFEAAAKVVAEKDYCISDGVLFNGVRKLVKFEKLRSSLTKCVYELLLKSRYDRNTIKLLTDCYIGGRHDWLVICNTLYKMGTPNRSVDEKLIKMSIQIKKFDVDVQKVFSFMYENDRNNELIMEFAEYCCYEVIINSARPENDTINILEKLFFSHNDEMISYALSHIYLLYNMNTGNTVKILSAAVKFMKKRNLIFPVFKECKYVLEKDLYMEKNWPFIYYAPSDKSVLFYFREKGEFDFSSKPMNYLDFGIYYINIPVFCGEEIEYYICENKEKGSVETQKQIISNRNFNFHTDTQNDPFFEINNSIIYENMGRYEDAEEIINKKIRKNGKLRCNLL